MIFDEADRVITPVRRRKPHGLWTEEGQWIGRRGSIAQGANQSIGSIVPAGLVFPNDYDQWDFNSTTDLSGVPDITANVQAAINLIQASGQGGVVQLPPGVLRINGVTISGGGVTIKGAGWEENIAGATPAARGKRGTYVLTDSVSASAITVAATASNIKIQDVAFIQPFNPDAVGWVDRFSVPTIALVGPNSGGVVVEKCLFWGVDTAISVGSSSSTPAGLITIRDCEMATFSIAININACTSIVIDNLKVVPNTLLANNANQLAYMVSNSIGVQIQNTTSLIMTNSIFSGINTAVYGINFVTGSNIKISDCDVSSCGLGLQDQGAANNWKVTGYNYVGRGAGKISRAIYFGGSNAIMDIVDSHLSNFGSSAILISTPSCDIRFGPNLWVDNWNLSPGLDGSVPNPSPALTVQGTSTCRYSLNGSRFTNANGGPNTGGTGTFTTY